MRAALLLLACAARADARYADQLGEFDWHVSNIGGVKRAVFQGRQAFVVTDVTGADRALVAALNARTGEVDWRHLLPEGEQGDEIAVFADAVVTLSGGSMVRAWRSSDGAAMWDIKAPGLARPDGKLFVTSHEGKCAVVALAGEAVLALDCETGSSLAGWPWFAEVGDDPKLAAALRPFSTGDLRLVDAASTGDGSIVVAGVSACGAVAVAATLRPFSSAESSTASAWPASGASHFNVLARADGTVSICYLQDAHVFVRDVETAATSFVAATGLLGEAAASLTAEPNSAFRVLRLRGALLQRFIVADGSTVAPVGPACADCALGAFATPLEAGQAARVFVAESFAVPGGTRTVSRAASPHSEALFSEEVAPLHSEQHGSPARVFLHLFEKRDKSEGDVGYRAMLTTSCDSVAMVGPNKVSWVREEALAFVTQAVFVAPKTLAVGPQAHTVLDRYKAQLRHLVDSARHTSLWTSAESKNEVREQTRQLNAKRPDSVPRRKRALPHYS
ncbi:hypothetical protein M885DRAFT_498396 [Pelagophyceae sp. CCMP2097]|nr:hypothetical protein M885DRAFT_498396 [Pelagophyceae sp. CCMP2097]